MLENMAYLAAIFFLPLMPAYLLYKFLPSKTTVRGPFKGLNINLTGAFGGYFLLVLVALGFAYSALTPSQPNYEVWEVIGKIEAKRIDPKTNDEIKEEIATVIGVTPPRFMIGSKGEFRMTIMVEPGHTRGIRKYPTLTFDLDGYAGIFLPLSDAETEVDEKMKIMRINQPIKLKYFEEKVTEPKWTR